MAPFSRHPEKIVRLQHLPNIITFARLLTVIPVVLLLLEREFGWALTLFALAGLSDGLDGFLAKRYGWQTRLGGILDPLADKTLLLACFLVLGILGLIPLWLVVAAILRDLVIIGGALVYNLLVEDLDAAPLLTSKVNTVLQILLVVTAIADAGPLDLPAGLIEALTWGCLVTILVSGVQYVYLWSRKAAEREWRR
nr:CDP-alcohol phosphatidyltransferase family protein [Thiococcus pfennigii]